MDSSIANNPAKPLNQIPDRQDPQFEIATAYGRPQDSPEYIKRTLAFEKEKQLAFEEAQNNLKALAAKKSSINTIIIITSITSIVIIMIIIYFRYQRNLDLDSDL